MFQLLGLRGGARARGEGRTMICLFIVMLNRMMK